MNDGSYFESWRRKFGVLSLATACALAAVWVRSYGTADIAESSECQIHSLKGSLFCEIVPDRLPFKLHLRLRKLPGVRHAYSHPSLISIWHWRALGFAYGSEEGELKRADGTRIHVTVYRWNIPYWSIVIPLTLLSAWLLLCKQQKRSPAIQAD